MRDLGDGPGSRRRFTPFADPISRKVVEHGLPIFRRPWSPALTSVPNTSYKGLPDSLIRLRPLLEVMEKRITLTGNIIITNALVDNANIALDHRERWRMGLYSGRVHHPESAEQCLIPRRVYHNGLTIYSAHGDWGAGQQTGFGNPCWGQFSASAGTNYVTVTVDPDHSLGLSSYADTTFSFTFDAVSPAVGYPCYTAAQIRSAYGINSIPDFGTATADELGKRLLSSITVTSRMFSAISMASTRG